MDSSGEDLIDHDIDDSDMIALAQEYELKIYLAEAPVQSEEPTNETPPEHESPLENESKIGPTTANYVLEQLCDEDTQITKLLEETSTPAERERWAEELFSSICHPQPAAKVIVPVWCDACTFQGLWS